MIIFDNAIYIHCPKTGGSSFEQMCWERHGIPVTGEQHDIAADIPSEHLHKSVFGFIRDLDFSIGSKGFQPRRSVHRIAPHIVKRFLRSERLGATKIHLSSPCLAQLEMSAAVALNQASALIPSSGLAEARHCFVPRGKHEQDLRSRLRCAHAIARTNAFSLQFCEANNEPLVIHPL